MSIVGKIIDTQIEKMQEYKPSSSIEYRFTPSSLGAKCERKVFYEYIRAPKDKSKVPITAKRAGVIGTYFGNMYSDLLENSGYLVKWRNPDGTTRIKNGKPDYEFEVSAPDLSIKVGYLDAVLVVDGKIYIGENKALSSRQYKKLIDEGLSSQYYYQTLVYLYLFIRHLKNGDYAHIKEFEGITEVAGVHITLFNKGENTFKEIVVTPNDARFKQVVARILRVKKAAQDKLLPPKTPDYCNYCPFKTLCDKNKIPES